MKKTLIRLLPCLVIASLATGCATAPKNYTGQVPFASIAQPKSASFYNPDGSFNQAIGKQAYYDMMRAYHYPISPMLKTEDFWTADFLQGDFAKVGMAGIFWKNVEGVYGEVGAKTYKGEFKDAKYGYLGHDIYLLPGQMLPEHSHLGSKKGFGPKMETWHITHGSVDFFSEYKGDGSETLISAMPDSAKPWGYGKPWFKSKYVTTRVAGEVYSLGDPESWHFMRAGKNGAIVSEFATYHNDVQFSDPKMEFGNSKAAEITKRKQ